MKQYSINDEVTLVEQNKWNAFQKLKQGDIRGTLHSRIRALTNYCDSHDVPDELRTIVNAIDNEVGYYTVVSPPVSSRPPRTTPWETT
jgi:hypothetical protein